MSVTTKQYQAQTKRLKNIRARYQKLRELRAQESSILAYLFIDAYHWVVAEVGRGNAKSTTECFRRIASTTGASVYTVNTWYYAGKLMQDYKLQPDKVCPSDVRTCRNLEGKIAKADWLKIVPELRAGRSNKVRRLTTAALLRSGHASKKRANAAREAGRWNKTFMKLEGMALLRIYQEFYKREGLSLVLFDENDEVLLEVQ